jgi:hypothetical protein
MSGNDYFVEDPQAPDEENARRFFGFSPHEAVEAFTLRARKMKRDEEAAGPRDRELAQRYFEVLAPLAGIPPRPAAEAPAERPAAAPRKGVPAADGDVYLPSPPAAVQSVIDRLRSQLDYALHTEVIQHTIVAYNNLFASLVQLARLLGVNPAGIGNAWVRSHMQPPAPETVSRTQLDEVLELLPERLHVSLGGTPEFNHPHHRYIAHAAEAREGLQFEFIIDAIRKKALDMIAREPRAQMFFA